jgi:hypothetical protein
MYFVEYITKVEDRSAQDKIPSPTNGKKVLPPVPDLFHPLKEDKL